MDTVTFMHPSFEKGVKLITKEYQRKVAECKELREQLANFRKDEEIKSLQAEINRVRGHSLMVLSGEECKAAEQFRKKHYEACKNGNDYWYNLVGTGIGTVIKIKCPVCMEEEDITDVSCW